MNFREKRDDCFNGIADKYSNSGLNVTVCKLRLLLQTIDQNALVTKSLQNT
jgi:hypothetical protein